MSCQARSRLPAETETVIIGNGPAALFLSYLLHGNVPYYNLDGRHAHPDRILHNKLKARQGSSLYEALHETPHLCEHFEASGRYSTDAWPVNVLLDALLWPNADVDWDCESTVAFVSDARYRRDHVVLGSASQAGGQWAETTGQSEGENAKTLSYSEQLSLPGYSFAQFHLDEYGREMAQLERPRRPQVTAYYAAYPARVQICDTLMNGHRVGSVLRRPDGSYEVSGTDASTRPFSLTCQRLVLACGLFTHLIEPPVMLSPYVGRNQGCLIHHRAPILIVGSGFSAADAVIENLGKRPVVHLFKWKTARYVSPLKHCHRSSYPEYADVFRRMKLSAGQVTTTASPDYHGYSDCEVTGINEVGGRYEVSFVEGSSGSVQKVVVGEIAVLAGRRTSLDFFEPGILAGLRIDSRHGWLEKSGLRDQITAEGPALTVDGGRVLCIGSITGDSLVKFMFGAAMGAASQIIGI